MAKEYAVGAQSSALKKVSGVGDSKKKLLGVMNVGGTIRHPVGVSDEPFPIPLNGIGELTHALTKVETKDNSKVKKIESALTDGQAKIDKQISQAKQNYGDRIYGVRNKTVKNGTANSSIRTANEEEAKEEYVEKMISAQDEYEKLYKDVVRQIKLIGEEREQALSDYNIELAYEIEEKLGNLLRKKLKVEAETSKD